MQAHLQPMPKPHQKFRITPKPATLRLKMGTHPRGGPAGRAEQDGPVPRLRIRGARVAPHAHPTTAAGRSQSSAARAGAQIDLVVCMPCDRARGRLCSDFYDGNINIQSINTAFIALITYIDNPQFISYYMTITLVSLPLNCITVYTNSSCESIWVH